MSQEQHDPITEIDFEEENRKMEEQNKKILKISQIVGIRQQITS